MDRFDYQQQLGDEERMRQEMDERGLDWQAHWERREQDMKDQRDFWRKWDARFNKRSV